MEAIAKVEIRELEQRFVKELLSGMSEIARAGSTLVELIKLDSGSRERLIQDYHIPRNTIGTLERIGSKLLRPELAFSDVRLRALPMSDQERVLKDKIEILVIKKDGTTDILKVNLLTAPAEIKRQVLNGDHIRTLDEQRAWLVAKNNQNQKTEAETVTWRTYGRKQVEILKAHSVFDRSALLSMLKAIED